MRRETFQKPGRQECADWDAQLNQAILTDIREGWEGAVELFNGLSLRMAPPHRKRALDWTLLGTRRGLDPLDGSLSRNGNEFHVSCRKGVAPYILDAESTRRFSGALVHDLQALLPARKEIVFSPLAQGDDYREQLATLPG